MQGVADLEREKEKCPDSGAKRSELQKLREEKLKWELKKESRQTSIYLVIGTLLMLIEIHWTNSISYLMPLFVSSNSIYAS